MSASGVVGHPVSSLPVSGSVPSPVQHAKLKKATQEFESILISELWKSARTSLGDDDEQGDAAAGTIKDMGVEAMAMGLAAHGGLGIGKMLLHQLEKASANSVGETPGASPASSQYQLQVGKTQGH